MREDDAGFGGHGTPPSRNGSAIASGGKAGPYAAQAAVRQFGGYQGARFGINRYGLRRRGFVVFPQQLPQTLEPGASVVEWMNELDDVEIMRAFFVVDSNPVGPSALRA